MNAQAEAAAWVVAHDPLVAVRGSAPGEHPVRGSYAEVFWLPVLGPSALWALRRLDALVEARGQTEVPLALLAAEIGLGHASGRQSPVSRSVARLMMFGVLAPSSGSLAVPAALPELPAHLRRKLPAHLVRALNARRPATGSRVPVAAP